MNWREVFGGGDVPFAALFRDLALKARGRLDAKRLSAECLDRLEEHLVERLSDLCAPAMQGLFERFRKAGRGGFARFVETGPLDSLFARYPVLGKLAESVREDWVAAARELGARLDRDWPEVLRLAGVGAGGEAASSLRAGLSDPHHGGRSAVRLDFAGGRAVVYKPRGMGAEAAFEKTLALLGMRAARTVDKGEYGWQEFIAAEECRSEQEVQQFYRCAGALLCVLYLLRGSDAHMGNVIAARSDAVLVDAECMLQPALLHDREGDIARPDEGALAGLLLRTAFLPRPESGGADLSGIGGAAGQLTDFRVPEWRDVNTDAMSLRMRAGRIKGQPNRARFGGTPVDATLYGAEIREGFAGAWRKIAELRRKKGGMEKLLAPWQEVDVRFLLRPTREYVEMINASLRPSCLRDACVRRERIARMLREGLIYEAFEAGEARAIERLDIPRFTVPAGGGGVVPVKRCGLEAARRRLAAAGDESLWRAERVLKALWILMDKDAFLH
jgi:type 2 lantibiotic biosynthesis protein LanM